jgi:polyphosphate kinase
LIGSADLMERNLDRRVEVLTPVRDPALRARLDEILGVLLADEALAWKLDGDGIWHAPSPTEAVDAQTRLEQAARAGARPILAV